MSESSNGNHHHKEDSIKLESDDLIKKEASSDPAIFIVKTTSPQQQPTPKKTVTLSAQGLTTISLKNSPSASGDSNKIIVPLNSTQSLNIAKGSNPIKTINGVGINSSPSKILTTTSLVTTNHQQQHCSSNHLTTSASNNSRIITISNTGSTTNTNNLNQAQSNGNKIQYVKIVNTNTLNPISSSSITPVIKAETSPKNTQIVKLGSVTALKNPTQTTTILNSPSKGTIIQRIQGSTTTAQPITKILTTTSVANSSQNSSYKILTQQLPTGTGSGHLSSSPSVSNLLQQPVLTAIAKSQLTTIKPNSQNSNINQILITKTVNTGATSSSFTLNHHNNNNNDTATSHSLLSLNSGEPAMKKQLISIGSPLINGINRHSSSIISLTPVTSSNSSTSINNQASNVVQLIDIDKTNVNIFIQIIKNMVLKKYYFLVLVRHHTKFLIFSLKF
jgi:hypothetical protein